jgi:hypothetical protein
MKRHISGQLLKRIASITSVQQKDKLLKLLQEFEELFDSTLGDWDCNLVLLQLKEGVQPYHDRPFQMPKKHVETLKKEIYRLCNLSVEVASRFQMGFNNLHHTKKGQHRQGC